MTPDTSIRRAGRAVLVVLLCAGLALQGCTTLRHVPVPADVPAGYIPDVRPGDRVEVTLRDGQMHRFRLIAITADGLEGTTQRVAFGDISVLHVRKVSAGRTVAAALGVIAATAVVAFGVMIYQITRGEEE